MLRFDRHAESLDETADIARDLAIVLRAGDVVRLEGELGAGKTTFVRSLAAALGIDPGAVSSPTFVLVNEYANPSGRPDLVHMDCYRMSGPDELDDLGWDRVIGSGAIVAVEWPERIEGSLPDDAARVRISHTGESARSFEFLAPASWDERPGIGGLEARQPTTCPRTGVRVEADNPSWPFADERARLADLHGWLTEKHVISRAVEQRDLDEGVD
ncbi:MAG: tRNA (adenosine(37)-N6)-threonylcarbamoyltransferase complex ATPase subunit type 1 TsaE [Phycisphaerales bacterium]